MAKRNSEWSLNIKTGIEVEKESFNKAAKVFDDFYRKYNNQEMSIDTSDMVSAVKKGLAEIYKLYKEGTLEDTSWLNIRSDMKDQFHGIMSDAEAMFDGIKVLFSDGSYVSGLSDIFSKFDQQLSVVFADVGGWFDKLEVKSRDLASILENLAQGSIGESGWFNTENVDLDVQDIKDIIRTLEELQQVQSEMSRMNPQLTRENFASGLGDKELNRAIKQSSSTLNELNRLNLSTTAELELHKSLIDTLYSNKWDDDSQDYTKANAYNKELFQEQLQSLQDFINERKKLAEQLKAHEYTLFSTEDISEYLAYNEHQIEIYENYLKELSKFKPGGGDLGDDIDFSEVTKGLNGIKQAIEELKDAFKPLTDAFADSDNALNKMVTSSIDDLNSLLNKFGELYDMVDTISKKDFNITNITQQNTTDIVSNTIRQYKQVARELSKQVASLYADSSKTAGILGSKGSNKYLTLLTNLATGDGTSKNSKIRYDGFALDDINKNINKAKSLDDIDSIIDQLNYFKKLLIEFNELRNTVKPGSYVNNFKDIQKQTDLLKENVADVKTAVDESKELNTLDQDIDIKTEPILEDIKTLGEQVGTELSSIRSKIEETFNFTTIDPNYEHIKIITDTIYSYFTELQSKINSLELKFTAPEGIHIATEAIKEEGEAAEVSAQQKQEFLKANKDVAASGPKTKAGVKEATEAIEEEGDVAEDSVKRIAMVQQANAGFEEANKGYAEGTVKLKGLSREDFELYATDIAKSKGMTVDDIQVRMGENGNMMTASVKMINEELAQSITYTYKLLELEENLVEAYLTGYTAKGNQNKALKIAAAAQKKADAERSQNNQWLIKQQKTLDSQENKYKYSSKSIDGSTALMSTETSLSDDAEHTIDSLTQHIKERIKNAISNGLTNELREQILNDLRILQNEISVEQSKQYSATKMKASTVETNKKAYKEYLRAFEANAKKSNIFEVMEQDIVDLGKELNKVTDADSMNAFVDKLNVAQKKFQAEKALLAQTEAENKKITKGQSFGLDVDRQFGLLTKQQAQWEKNGQLTDELRQKIENMFNALTEVTDSSGLSIWKKQWMILKDEVMQTKYEIEAANKAQQASDAVTQAERNASGVYWGGRFKDSINNLGPQKRPELEQLKVYMLQQADVTKDSVIEQYDAIMTIISNKNEALRKLMSAKGPAEQQYWQKEYSAWFGAWNALDQDVIGDFFANAGNQAMLGTDKIKKFNDAIETSKLLSAQQQDSKSKQDNQNLENAINLQNKLYAAKKQLAKVDAASAKGQELSRRIDELQEEYDTSLKLLRIDEDRQVARERELKLEKELNAIKQQTKNNQNRSYGKTQYDRELKYFDNIKAKTTALKQDSEISDLLDNKIQEYEGVLKRLENLRNTFINDPTAFDNDGLKNNFQSAVLEAENLRKEILGIFKETDKLANIPSDSLMGIKSLTDLDLGSIKQEMATFIAQLTDGQFKFEGFNAAGTEMHGVLDRGNGLIEQVTVALDRGTNSLYAYQTGTKQVSNSWQNLGSALKEGTMRLAGQYIGFHEAVQALRSGITYVRDIDLALTELKKVTDETDATYKQFLKDMASTASVIGSTTKDLTNSAADWARVGYDIREAGELAKSTAVLMNVSEFDNVEAATEALTSTLQAFNYSAEDSIKIVDKLNTIGNNFAISSYGAAEGLKRSAATLVAAGNSLEESLAMLAAGNRVMQDPEAMGNALKVLSMRIRGVKTELEEAGEETDGMITNTSKLQEKVEALTNVDGTGGINILTETGAFKSTYQILLGISEVWDKMDSMSQAGLLEILAGKVRGSQVAAILQNPEDLKDAYEMAFNSAGSAMAENEKYLDSIQGRIDLFTTALETFWQNVISSDAIKWIVDRGTSLIELLDTLHGKIIAIVAALAGFAKVKGFSVFGLGQDLVKSVQAVIKAQSVLQTLGTVIPTSTGLSTESIQAYAVAVSNLTAKQQANMLATVGLNKAQIQYAMQCNGLTDDVIREATAHVFAKTSKEGELQVEAQLLAVKTQSLAASLRKQAAEAGEATTSTNNVIAKRLEVLATQQLSKEQLLEEIRSWNLSSAKEAEIVATLGLSKANLGLAGSIKAVWSSMSLLGKIGSIIGIVSAVYSIGKMAYEYFNVSTDELIQKWDDAKSKISDINSELKDTQSRIKELEAQGALSFTDKKELEQLRQQNDELERRLRLEEAAAEEAGNKAKKAIEDDYNQDFIKEAVITKADLEKYNKAYNITDVFEALYTNTSTSALAGFTEEQKSLIKNLVPTDVYNELASQTWSGLSDGSKQVINNIYKKYEAEMQDLSFVSDQYSSEVFGETYIDQAVQKIKEYKEEIFDVNGQLKDGLDDEYVVEITTNIDDLESDLADTAVELYDYIDKYGGDASDAFVQQLQAQIDKIDMAINPVDFYNKKFEQIFGDFSNEKRALYELAEQGQLTANTLNSTAYDPLMREMNALGVTAQDVADHINALSKVELQKVTDPTFSIKDYETNLDSLQECISEYQSALASLEEGTFTYSDFIDLTQKFPELAKGVDTSSKSFTGLAKNLRKAIKSSPKELIKTLKSLREQLKATGKSTDDIDLLIESIENLPDEAVKDLAKDYSTLADEINGATKAQHELEAAMSENPNAGYETRGEALEYMKDKMGRGEIGSESELWTVAEKYGFTYDSSKSIEENADALAYFIDVREQWFTEDEDGNYTYHGTQEFIEDVERAVQANKELQEILEWNYNSDTGELTFDFDNKDLPKIIEHLSQSEHLVGLTTEEWIDMMKQIGQYFGLDWGDFDDEYDHLNEIATSASNAKTKVEEYGTAMQEAFGKGDVDLTQRPEVEFNKTNFDSWATYYQKIIDESEKYTEDYVAWTKEQLASINTGDSTATVYSSTYYKSDFMELKDGEANTAVVLTPILPDKTVLSPEQLEAYAEKILRGEEIDVDGITLGVFENEKELKGFEENLHKAQEQYFELVRAAKENPFSMNINGDNIETDIVRPLKEAGLKFDEFIDETGQKQFKPNVVDLETLMRDNGYTTENIMAVVNRLFGEGSEQSNLIKVREDIQNINSVSQETVDKLKELGVAYHLVGNSQGASIYVDSNIEDILKKYQFTDQEIAALKTKWETNGIRINTNADTTGAEQTEEAVKKIPEETETKVKVVGVDEAIYNVELFGQALDNATVDRSATVTVRTINETVNVTTETNSANVPTSSAISYGRPTRVNGTAHAGGSWGAPRTETALTGELGPELRVRGNRWDLLGENGAEFADIQKGDIIFNHKQTEQLLSNGYVTSRGKAYASGTAYASGGGKFTFYKFNGDKAYTKHGIDELPSAMKDSSDEADKFEEVLDWVEIRLEEINEQLDFLNAKLENAVGYVAQNNIIDQMLGVNNSKLANLQGGLQEYINYAAKLLQKIPAQYQAAAQDGAIAITEFAGKADEATVEAINNYREWAQKVADLTQQIEELETEIADLAKQKFDNVTNQFENEISLIEAANDKLDAQISLMEDRGYIAAKEYYEAMAENTEERQKALEAERKAAQAVLDAEVSADNMQVGDDRWYDAINTLYDIDAAIVECDADLESFQNAINDIYWDNFDELINRYDYLSDETQNLIDLMERADMVSKPDNEDGWAANEVEWTKEGIASLGLYAQQMEIAEYKSKQYAKAIDDLNKDYADGKYSEIEYLEKLNELKDAQYDSIEAYYDAQDAIKDLNEARVDEIKNGIEKQIKAYDKLIKKQKEELSAEKDMHDFQKSVADQQKNITNIQRKIDALANDNSISAAAQRKQLLAELAEAEYELEETYYDRSVEDQQNALDRELESFTEVKEKEIEQWDKYLENIEQVVADSLGIVQANASGVYDTLTGKAKEYGLTISDAVMAPWQSGAQAVSNYQTKFDTAASATTDQLAKIKLAWQGIITEMEKAAGIEIDNQISANNRYIAAENPVESDSSSDSDTNNTNSSANNNTSTTSNSVGVGSTINAGNATIYATSSGGGANSQYYSSDPVYVVIGESGNYWKVRHRSLSSGTTGWFKKSDVKAYAKGTLGVPENQIAWLDELGEELVMHADGNGRLSFLTKGTSVIPADLTKNLMQLGELNPQDILDRSRPVISAPQITNNNIELNLNVAEIVHVDTVTNETLPNLTKVIDKQLDKYMKNLNNQVRKYSR